MSKTNHTGRSSGKWTRKEKAVFGPPQGEDWVWHTTELICSPAWKAMAINTRRLIDFLEVEHRNHAGRENGSLMATYDQLSDFGLSRRTICAAIDEAEFLGLIRTVRGGRWAETNRPSFFCITFYADKNGSPATNEWKGKTREAIDTWKRDRSKLIQARKNRRTNLIHRPRSDTTVVHLHELPTGKLARGNE